MSSENTITKTININHKAITIEASAAQTLLNLLREDLRLTGTKRGCDIGVCGTCTVLINKKPKCACVIKLEDLNENDDIITIEGISSGDDLHPVQQAFIDGGAVQCGFCTPGMIMTTIALLDKNPNPTRDEIKKAFAKNLCRCTGYEQIFESVERAGRNMHE
ncbi:MAG: (2Fe-2S)-binding protein [bacterium]